MKRVMVHLDRCYGCLTCEAACVAAHALPDQAVTTETIMAAYGPATMGDTRIWVSAQAESHAPFPVTCRHCVSPACARVCSVGALRVAGEDDAVLPNDSRCAGCWMCVMVCPFGAIARHGDVALKCDLCQGRDAPACVAACPNGALEFVEVEVYADARRSAVAGAPFSQEG